MIHDHPHVETLKQVTRRYFLQDCWTGLGAIALASLWNEDTRADAVDPMALKSPHFPAKVKQVVFLCMEGGPSQLELFDFKPKLIEMHGKPLPASIAGEQRFAFIKAGAPLRGTERKFQKAGQSGMEISDVLPHTATIADNICLIRSMNTDLFNHSPAQMFMFTGSGRPGRPSMGSWVTYGLGSEAKGLPGFVVLHSHSYGETPGIMAGASCWSSGFLPTAYEGVVLRNTGDPILSLSNPRGVDRQAQRDAITFANEMNRHRQSITGDPEISARIASLETAYQMQMVAPEVCDISREPKHILDLYGCRPGEMSFANNCLLARRLLEKGVRFISLYHKGWDHHGTDPNQGLITSNLEQTCRDIDQPCAALVKDLRQRGMLDETLVVWGGEFGRTPMGQAPRPDNPLEFLGRDHHPNAYSIWMAGGGVKPGLTFGETDDFGFHITRNRVHVHDLQATILHLLGLDHTKLTFRFRGREFRLTDVAGEVVEKILA
jgi:hypothetical protein